MKWLCLTVGLILVLGAVLFRQIRPHSSFLVPGLEKHLGKPTIQYADYKTYVHKCTKYVVSDLTFGQVEILMRQLESQGYTVDRKVTATNPSETDLMDCVVAVHPNGPSIDALMLRRDGEITLTIMEKISPKALEIDAARMTRPETVWQAKK